MDDDPLVRAYDASEREIAAQFLTDWLPFLSQGLCPHCSTAIRRRIHSLRPPAQSLNSEQVDPISGHQDVDPSHTSNCITPSGWDPPSSSSTTPTIPTNSIVPSGWDPVPEPSTPAIPTSLNTEPVTESTKTRASWADMAQEEDELEGLEEETRSRREEDRGGHRGKWKTELSREQKELNRFRNVKRNKEFMCLERVNGKIVNIVEGLELHAGVFSPIEQKRIVDFVYQLLEKGQNGELRERTYSSPAKWMKGKGRITMQFGCNYNYATDRKGNPPGILRNVAADPMPELFKTMIKRLLKWHVLPLTCVPDSCIVNIYEPGDCIPPHTDSHDFVRPFCTVSFLSECNILFGSNLEILGPGEFGGSYMIPLPVGSVLVLNGNGADVAKHCVPAVPMKRISITFRKMEKSKWPVGFALEPDLQNVVPLLSDSKSAIDEKDRRPNESRSNSRASDESPSNSRASNSSLRFNIDLNSNSSSSSNSNFNSRGGRRFRGKAPIMRN